MRALTGAMSRKSCPETCRFAYDLVVRKNCLPVSYRHGARHEQRHSKTNFFSYARPTTTRGHLQFKSKIFRRFVLVSGVHSIPLKFYAGLKRCDGPRTMKTLQWEYHGMSWLAIF